ncbi:MAG: hypothetical protein H0T60_13765 [Acidobacteria bacterium]|nr:hypothetical protein [Acidobacteriota bacterium]
MIDYTASDAQKIAAISTSEHVGLLTNCGLCPDHARQIIAMTDANLLATVAKYDAMLAVAPKKTDLMIALIAAGNREIMIRNLV